VSLKKNFLIFISFFLSLNIQIFAQDQSMSIYVDSGQKLYVDDFNDILLDGAYKYINQGFGYEQKVNKNFEYYFKSYVYERYYFDLPKQDSETLIYKTKLMFDTKSIKKFNINFDYKEKKYENKPTSDYNQFKIISSFAKLIDDNLVDITAGVTNSKYVHSLTDKSENNINARLKYSRTFFDESLDLELSERIDVNEQNAKDRRQTKLDTTGEFAYKFNAKYLTKISGMAKFGTKDTKNEDTEDIDTDYDYVEYALKTEHKITSKIATDLKFNYDKKNYLIGNQEIKRFFAKNHVLYEIIKTKDSKFWTNIYAEFGEIKYTDNSIDNYQKMQGILELNFKQKEQFKIYSEVNSSLYDYSNNTKDKTQYHFMAGLEKYCFENKLTIGLEAKINNIIYDNKNDTSTTSLKLTLNLKF
jgi:hypothetical protein